MGGWSQAPLARFYICAIVLACVEQKDSIDGCSLPLIRLMAFTAGYLNTPVGGDN